MFKKIITISLFGSIAFAQDIPSEWHGYNGSSEIFEQQQPANEYIAVISYLESRNCHVSINEIIHAKDDVLYIWSGDYGCSGGSGTFGMGITSLSSDGIKYDYFGLDGINYRFLSDTKKISDDHYELTTADWDDGDGNNFPSITVKVKVTRDNNGLWQQEEILRTKEEMGYDFSDKEDELIAFYEAYRRMSEQLLSNRIVSILKDKGTPYLFIVDTDNGYKIMSYDIETDMINRDYFNYKYNDLVRMQSFKIINSNKFEFSIEDEHDYDEIVTYNITMDSNGKWITTEVKRDKRKHDW